MDGERTILRLCTVCHDAMATRHTDAGHGKTFSICDRCQTAARENFIWVCTHCGSVNMQPRQSFLRQLSEAGYEGSRANYAKRQGVLSIDKCMECDPQGVDQAVKAAEQRFASGHC
ncbi:MAG: hypothetical protein M0042_03265 [Nitrospiraceae bacterium]|nr:hypothetical protein [Nitrospiraceae bacterium]